MGRGALGVGGMFKNEGIYVYLHIYGAASSSCAVLEQQAAERRYPTFKARSSGCALLEQHEEITHVPGKKNPSKRVGAKRGHQRADRLKPQSQKTNQSNHIDHSLV